MPGYTTYSDLPYPLDADADRVPDDLHALATALDTTVVLHAADATERDAKYDGIRDGVLCICDADGTIWVSVAGEWLTIARPPGPWLLLPLRDDAVEASFAPPRYRLTGSGEAVQLRGSVQPKGGGTFSGSSLVIADLPAGYWPPITIRAVVAREHDTVADLVAARIDIDSSGKLTALYDNGPGWIGLDLTIPLA